MRYKSWHAECNSAAKSVLMCDSTQLSCSLLAVSHYLAVVTHYVLDALNATPMCRSVCDAVMVSSVAICE